MAASTAMSPRRTATRLSAAMPVTVTCGSNAYRRFCVCLLGSAPFRRRPSAHMRVWRSAIGSVPSMSQSSATITLAFSTCGTSRIGAPKATCVPSSDAVAASASHAATFALGYACRTRASMSFIDGLEVACVRMAKPSPCLAASAFARSPNHALNSAMFDALPALNT